MIPEQPDWPRLQKALAKEAEQGFNDLVGRQYCFSEFLSLSLRQSSGHIPADHQERWQRLADRYARYPDLTFAQRQHLVAETRNVIYQTRRSWEAAQQLSLALATDTPADESGTQAIGNTGGDTGRRDTGNTGRRDTGNTGRRDTGNTGRQDTGNTGRQDTGNTGRRDTGNTGRRDTGNTGRRDTGNTGRRDTGNTGRRDTGNTGRRDAYPTSQSSRGEALATPPAKRPRTMDLIPRESQGQQSLALDQALTHLNGVGPRQGKQLGELGLITVRDLLYYFPRDYIDYARQVTIRDLEPGETVTIVATVKRCNCFTSPRNSKLTILEWVLQDHTGQIKLSRFMPGARFANRGWQEQQRRRYPPGAIVAASGLVKDSKYGLTIEQAEIEVLDHQGSQITSLKVGRVVPVYSLTSNIGADVIRRAVLAALPAAKQLKDPLPQALRQKYGLIDLPTAIAHIHYPPDPDSGALARRRLVFEEFFYLQLSLLQRRHQQRQSQRSVALPPTGKLIDQFYQLLPFQLTGAQQRVINEILTDLQQPQPMNRLVQGDVGSGKTVVAVVALLAAIQAGYQGAMMAPTEVLAEQHYRKLVEWFNLLQLPVELLTGSTRTAKRREIYRQLATGELPLIVGTHALIQDTVQFHQLGLIVIDEQHRFGVEQRAKLQQKGIDPHVLTMTATPIPRTLTLTLHGDLDVSQIDELPPGRQAIQTTVLFNRDRPHAYDLMRREIAQGRQVYVVLPLVEESEKMDLKSATAEYQRLQEVIFPEFRVGLLHGRMSSADKDAVINQFRDKQLHILVSTTVIEVGVDIPNATVMLIEHAERFGLSQLHQLRGRVGRGAQQSYCLLMSSAKSEVAQQRLRVLEQSQDGFFISEMDLRFRGPGEVLGTRQSGLPDFALASLLDDQEILNLARGAAERVMQQDPTLARWPLMKQELIYRYQRLLGGAILI